MASGATTRRGRAATEIVADWVPFLRLGSLACALVLVLAAVAPADLARTAWITDRVTVTDTAAGYVGWVAVLGLATVGLIGLGSWRPRVRVLAALLAAAAFGVAALVMARHWVGVTSGWLGAEGRMLTDADPAADWVQFPVLLPFFLVYALVGAACALALGWCWRDEGVG